MNSESLHKPFVKADRLTDVLTIMESLAQHARAAHLTEADELLAEIIALLLGKQSSNHQAN
jgi:hypothetical protein